jgi:hypothetical protein
MAAATSMFGQLVNAGPPDPHYCYQVEHVKPNLILSRATHLSGQIIDASGAPLENSPVELRLYVTEARQTSVKKVQTGKDGNFDLGVVSKGDYRFIASPTRVFKQAETLECGDRDPCVLSVVLHPSPTDQPENLCPVK